MKKVFFIAAIAAASIFGLNNANDVNDNNKMSDLQLENVELLAEGEITAGEGYAYWECFGYVWVCDANPNDTGFTGGIRW